MAAQAALGSAAVNLFEQVNQLLFSITSGPMLGCLACMVFDVHVCTIAQQ